MKGKCKIALKNLFKCLKVKQLFPFNWINHNKQQKLKPDTIW